MPTVAAIILVLGVGYLLGSVTVANRVARRYGVTDLRLVGDRNPGYWNAREQLGVRAALPVFVVDTGKGALAAGLGWLLADTGQWWLAAVGGAAAMIGHAWPALSGFRGGRSVLTFVGAASVFAPIPAAVASAAFLVVWLVARNFAWGARVGVALFPVAQILIEGPHRTALTGTLMTFIGFRFLTMRNGLVRNGLVRNGLVPGAKPDTTGD